MFRCLRPCFLLLLLPFGCQSKPDNVWPDKPGPKVLTSFAPIHCFTLNVAGDDAVVKTLLTNRGPHDHGDQAPLQLKLANNADVMFINGLAIDNELGSRIKNSSGKSDFNLVALGDLIEKKCLLEGACHHVGGHKHGDEDDHGFDPHVWLSPKHARTMVGAIRDELKKIDPSHSAGYESRAAAYLATLEKLEKDGIALLKDKKERKVIAFHDSLRYFGESYGIGIEGYIQSEPGIEPTAGRMKDLIALCKDKGIRVIAVEPQYPRNTSAGTILSELKKAGIDAEFVEIDPLETADEGELTADLYERKMRQNLENLAKALR